MQYISTRGEAPALSFEQAVLTGLAADGGLYVPDQLPFFSKDEIASWQKLSYQELMFVIVQPFVNGEIEDDELKQIIARAYAKFRHAAIAPLVQTDHNEWILELFHGPTLAFKDFALQFFGQLLDSILAKRKQKVVGSRAVSFVVSPSSAVRIITARRSGSSRSSAAVAGPGSASTTIVSDVRGSCCS